MVAQAKPAAKQGKAKPAAKRGKAKPVAMQGPWVEVTHPWQRVMGWYRKGPHGCTQLNLWTCPDSMEMCDMARWLEKSEKPMKPMKAPMKRANTKAK